MEKERRTEAEIERIQRVEIKVRGKRKKTNRMRK